jgi:hypothetical protein
MVEPGVIDLENLNMSSEMLPLSKDHPDRKNISIKMNLAELI